MNNLSSMTDLASESFLVNVKEEANCILAEIVRLAGFLTQDFTDPASSKYKLLVLDFNYFSRAAHYEKLIEDNEDLQDSFYNAYGDLLSRFSTLFQTIANFVSSLKEYCEQVGQERVGVSYLDIVDIEILFNMGLVVLYLEKYLPGPVRERIYVAVYRNSDERRNVDFLADFLRVHSANSEPCYLFERLKMSNSFVDKCLSCCETIHREGINDFGKAYVDRVTLVKWVFVCLLFKPITLKTDFSKMRQIVEDFFRDEWVLQLGLGLNVNLLDSWQSYRAAFTAITNQVDVSKAKDMATYHYNALSKLTIPQGKILPNDFDADIHLISQYNSSLRWLILHTSKLHDWFLLMKKTLEELEINDKRNAEFVSQVKRRIIQVGEMLDLGGNLSVAQHLHKLESHLDTLSALYNVREEEERRAQRFAEPSYIWPILDDWTPRIQRRILESSNVHAIRALFFKLSLSISTLCDQFQRRREEGIGQLLLLLSMLCTSRKQHCQLHAAPLFATLTSCDKYLLAHPSSVPADIGPIVNLLRDCGLSTPTLALHKINVVPSPNSAICLLVALYVNMTRFNVRTYIFCEESEVHAIIEDGNMNKKYIWRNAACFRHDWRVTVTLSLDCPFAIPPWSL
ncbi:hypothetical protein OESDEN_08364 [Oesophagostomum dentatum]|uniref:Uncharacterized protein n=1 Tax=Oesophagostomum dentatum TaxID=61180 RepID=A0A0B1T8R3_OESDE|nr:hypothetical protein OESDEN_08364 [Oesophagostomum dentatum]